MIWGYFDPYARDLEVLMWIPHCGSMQPLFFSQVKILQTESKEELTQIGCFISNCRTILWPIGTTSLS